ncbi:MAG: PAS domain-containing protein, partial [Anaerolineae bacterium]|nr:PAS domain-containing protein [Anaerolineae bacterium]
DINGMLQSFDQTQDMLHQMESRLTLVLSSMPVILFVLDRSGRLSLVAGAGLDLLSLTPDAALGRPLAALFGNSEGAFESLNRVLDGSAVRDTVQAGQAAFDIWLLPQLDADHAVTGAIGMAVDVTARQRSEHSLEQMETDLRARNASLDQAYAYFSGVLAFLQGAVRQGSAGDDLLALLGEAEVGVISHKNGAGGPHSRKNHRQCPNLNRCPAFRLLQLQAREVFMELYCEAEYERCARLISANRGERVPDNLMPHGVLL